METISSFLNKNKHRTIFNRFIRVLLAIALLEYVFGASLLLYENRQKIASLITVKPDTFTELYFEDNENLPLKTVNKQILYPNMVINSYSFSFTIHNLENEDKEYAYEVYYLGVKKVIFDEGLIFIKNNGKRTIDEAFLMPDLHSKTEVIVNLTENNQYIDFWLPSTIKKPISGPIVKRNGI